jgi:hypothetical protein
MHGLFKNWNLGLQFEMKSSKPFQHHMKVYGLLNHQKSTKMASPSCHDFAKLRKVSSQIL